MAGQKVQDLNKVIAAFRPLLRQLSFIILSMSYQLPLDPEDCYWHEDAADKRRKRKEAIESRRIDEYDADRYFCRR